MRSAPTASLPHRRPGPYDRFTQTKRKFSINRPQSVGLDEPRARRATPGTRPLALGEAELLAWQPPRTCWSSNAGAGTAFTDVLVSTGEALGVWDPIASCECRHSPRGEHRWLPPSALNQTTTPTVNRTLPRQTMPRVRRHSRGLALGGAKPLGEARWPASVIAIWSRWAAVQANRGYRE